MDDDSEAGSMFYAIQANDSVQLSYYIRNGADVNMTFQGQDPNVKSRHSVLHLCCQKGHYDCAKYLIDSGKNCGNNKISGTSHSVL